MVRWKRSQMPFGLRVPGLCPAGVDVLHDQIQFVLVVLALSAVFRAAISEHTQQRDLVLLQKGQHTVVKQICRDQRVLAIMEFGEGHLGVGVEKRLLIDAAYALDRAHVVSVLLPK
jgi:hypothetical protein